MRVYLVRQRKEIYGATLPRNIFLKVAIITRGRKLRSPYPPKSLPRGVYPVEELTLPIA